MKDSKKLISARIDPETMDKIEAFKTKYQYWTRNYIIDKILFAVMKDFDEKDIYDMVRRSRWTMCDILAKYKIEDLYITRKEHEDGKDS